MQRGAPATATVAPVATTVTIATPVAAAGIAFRLAIMLTAFNRLYAWIGTVHCENHSRRQKHGMIERSMNERSTRRLAGKVA